MRLIGPLGAPELFVILLIALYVVWRWKPTAR